MVDNQLAVIIKLLTAIDEGRLLSQYIVYSCIGWSGKCHTAHLRPRGSPPAGAIFLWVAWVGCAEANRASAPLFVALLWHDRVFNGTLEVAGCRGGLAEFAKWGDVAGAACSSCPAEHWLSSGPIPCWLCLVGCSSVASVLDFKSLSLAAPNAKDITVALYDALYDGTRR